MVAPQYVHTSALDPRGSRGTSVGYSSRPIGGDSVDALEVEADVVRARRHFGPHTAPSGVLAGDGVVPLGAVLAG